MPALIRPALSVPQAANRGISLITIDLDDTLWPCAPTIARAEAALFAWLRKRVPRVTAVYGSQALAVQRRSLLKQRPDIAHDITRVRLLSLQQLLAEFGYAEALADEAMDVFLEERNRVEPYADVAPALEPLARRYRLVSVTNGNADVKRTPLGRYFELVLSAAEVGRAKPSPDIFRAALEQTGVDPSRALHVGDDPHLDIEPARKLGMRTVWMNRGRGQWPGDLPVPDATVADLGEFRRWLPQPASQEKAF